MVGRDSVVGSGTQVRDHNVAFYAGCLRRIHGADGGVAVDGIGAFGTAHAARASRPDEHLGPQAGEKLSHLLDTQRGDINDLGSCAACHKVGTLRFGTDDAGHLMAGINQHGFGQQRDLAVTANNCYSCHGVLLRLKGDVCSFPV